ncbi:fibroblast growth factor receptor 3-like [Oscarella lobularis]|uniref:fibroblast growth factor receptor 3-like n=1 Tax=Oscarella lobularis TaxID=121494 RepID=UPI0033143A9F
MKTIAATAQLLMAIVYCCYAESTLPVFVDKPLRMVLEDEGATFRLKCSDGSNSTTTEWYRVDRIDHKLRELKIEHGRRVGEAMRFAVKSNGTLEVQNASVHAEGSYYCKLTNERGRSKKWHFRIIIFVRPKAPTLYAPARVEVAVGETTRVSCRIATSSSDSAHIRWKSDEREIHNYYKRRGEPINVTDRRLYAALATPDERVLVIRNAELGDGGNYTCTANTLAYRRHISQTTEVVIIESEDHDVGEIARAKNVQVARVNFRAGH